MQNMWNKDKQLIENLDNDRRTIIKKNVPNGLKAGNNVAEMLCHIYFMKFSEHKYDVCMAVTNGYPPYNNIFLRDTIGVHLDKLNSI